MSVSERRSSATPLESAGLVDAIPPIRYRCHGCGVAVDDSEDITLLLTAAASRSPEAIDRLVRLVRDELRLRAASEIHRIGTPDTIEPTALVHEAYLRLFGPGREPTWENRRHFFMAATRAMHDVLVERARTAVALKRGGGRRPEPLGNGPSVHDHATRFLELHDALAELERLDPDRASVVRLRFYGGFRIDEIAELIGMSPRTVSREWAVARVWLQNELGDDPVDLTRNTGIWS